MARTVRGAPLANLPDGLIAYQNYQVICPTGTSREFVSSPSAKNISLPAAVDPDPKSIVFSRAFRLDTRGVRVVTNAGRDAVDVAASGARWCSQGGSERTCERSTAC
jgi:hypothetical protein